MLAFRLSYRGTNLGWALVFETEEVSMHKPKHEPEPIMAARLRVEARAMLAMRADKRSRFLDVALCNGREFEPVGRLAG